jgi:hypothetical protein
MPYSIEIHRCGDYHNHSRGNIAGAGNEGEKMDRVMKITLALFFIILAAFIGMVAYNGYVDTAYRNTFFGNYSYTCTISTDAPLSNVTFFIPVPADREGNSPVVSAFSSHTVNGIPAEWQTALYDTGKSTMIKVEVPAIVPPEGTTASNPYTLVLSSEASSRNPIDTKNPVDKSAMFRPVQALTARECPQEISTGAGAQCTSYTTSLYADYTTSPDTIMTIQASITGRNTWTIFEPRSNEYRTVVITVMKGSHKGWVAMDGILSSGAGTYDISGGA